MSLISSSASSIERVSPLLDIIHLLKGRVHKYVKVTDVYIHLFQALVVHADMASLFYDPQHAVCLVVLCIDLILHVENVSFKSIPISTMSPRIYLPPNAVEPNLFCIGRISQLIRHGAKRWIRPWHNPHVPLPQDTTKRIHYQRLLRILITNTGSNSFPVKKDIAFLITSILRSIIIILHIPDKKPSICDPISIVLKALETLWYIMWLPSYKRIRYPANSRTPQPLERLFREVHESFPPHLRNIHPFPWHNTLPFIHLGDPLQRGFLSGYSFHLR